jgi:hypothetical protein
MGLKTNKPKRERRQVTVQPQEPAPEAGQPSVPHGEADEDEDRGSAGEAEKSSR